MFLFIYSSLGNDQSQRRAQILVVYVFQTCFLIMLIEDSIINGNDLFSNLKFLVNFIVFIFLFLCIYTDTYGFLHLCFLANHSQVNEMQI